MKKFDTTSGDPIAVLVFDAQPIVQQAIASLLERHGLEVVAHAADTVAAFSAVEQKQPDLVILDLAVDDVSGLAFVRSLAEDFPELRILVFSGYDEVLFAERCVLAGAHGYVMKTEPAETFLAAVHTVMAGGAYLSEAVRQRAAESQALDASLRHVAPMQRLTNRELEVMESIGRGRSTRDTAAQLGISVKTVESHRANIKVKLGLRSGTELLQYAIAWLQGR